DGVRFGVDAGSFFKKRLDQVHWIFAVGGQVGVFVVVEVAKVHGGEQGGAAVGVGGVGVRPSFEKIAGESDLSVDEREYQRRGAIARGPVDIGAIVEQELGDFEIAVAHGEEQGRHAAGSGGEGPLAGEAGSSPTGDARGHVFASRREHRGV